MVLEGIDLIRSDDIHEYTAWLSKTWDAGAHRDWVKLLIRNFSRGDGMKVIGGSPDASVALIYEDAHVVVQLRCLSDAGRDTKNAGVVSTSPVSSAIMPISGGVIAYRRYEVDGFQDVHLHSRAAKIREVSAGTCRAGEIVEILRGPHCLSLKAPVEVFAIQVSTKKSDQLSWAFDRVSGRSLGVSSASIGASRVQLACRALAELGSYRAVDSLRDLARNHSFHFVRMEAIRSLFILNDERLLELLRERALEDPHPHVRTACSRNLSRMLEAA